MPAYTDLIHRGFTTVEGEILPVRGMLGHLDKRQVIYVAVDVGTWFTRDTALVAAANVDFSNNSLTYDLRKEHVEHAPRWGGDDPTWFEQFGLSSLPPIIVGPFGNTVSPLMLAAAVQPPHPQEDRPIAPVAQIDSLTSLGDVIGAEAFGTDGPLGHVRDLEIREDGNIAGFVLEHQLRDVPALFLIPQERFSHRGEEHGHLVFDTTASGVRRAELLAS
ncbi:MAG: hypothetical protein AAFR93_08315 [Pseudomonadota bacterium]